MRDIQGPIHLYFCRCLHQFKYNRLSPPHGSFSSDNMFSKVTSLRGYTYGQVFTNDLYYIKFVPLKSKGDAPNDLKLFVQDVGIPTRIYTDDAQELTRGEWSKLCMKYDIQKSKTEAYSPWKIGQKLP